MGEERLPSLREAIEVYRIDQSIRAILKNDGKKSYFEAMTNVTSLEVKGIFEFIESQFGI